jgi:outer membrane autotransporter protein
VRPVNVSIALRRYIVTIAGCAILLCRVVSAHAQSSVWDTTISNTNWYVPVPHLLAYAAPATSFANPIPIGDQTLWTLGVSTNGVFTGLSNAELALGPVTVFSDSTIQGLVTTSGQITMVFTPVGGGVTTVGLGQMRDIGGGLYGMEMQMMTGDSLLITHWAAMLPYDPGTFTPPAAAPVPTNASPQWAWTAGTPWRIVSPALFGSTATGRFYITDYKNGYFWGAGVGPSGSPTQTFTLLGSITPEGKVLFNTLSQGNLTNLYGDITGNALSAQMLLSEYDSLGISTGSITAISLIRPYAELVRAINPAAAGAAAVLYRIAGSPLWLSGALADVVDALNNLDAPALANAVSQTLPVMAGAASQSTARVHTAVRQVVEDRLDAMDTAHAAGRHIWLKPFGGIWNQTGLNGIAGYRATGGGMAAGIDGDWSAALALGGMLAYSQHSVTGSDDTVPNSLRIAGYHAGLYGRYGLASGFEADLQIAASLNRNSESRSIAFVGRTAEADYDSRTAHIGAGLRKAFAVSSALTLFPSLRAEFTQVNADAYSEAGGGGLSLNVDSQVYREFRLTGGLRSVLRVTDGLRLTAQAGVGYDILDEPIRITAGYSGGGGSFVTEGIAVSPWLFSTGVGLTGAVNDRIDLDLRYDLQASPTGFWAQAAAVSLRIRL